MEAYHAPHFQTNILAVTLLTEFFSTLFTKDPPALNFKSTCLCSRGGFNFIVDCI